MVDLYPLGLIGQAGSGGAVLLLGLLVLFTRPQRRYTVSFGLFLVGWGAFVLLGNLGSLALYRGDPVLARRLLLLHLAVTAVAYLPLLRFAASYPLDPPGWTEHPAVVAGAVLPALLAGGALLLDPGLLHQGFAGTGAQARSTWGPLAAVVQAAFFLALYGTVWLLHHRRLHARHALERRRIGLVVLALLLYAVFETVENLVLGLGSLGSGLAMDLGTAALLLTSLFGFAVVGAVLHDMTAHPARGRWHGLGVASFTVGLPAVFGLLSGASIALPAWPPLLTLGLWRLGVVALLAYAILRFEVFGALSPVPRVLALVGLVGVTLAILLSAQTLLAGLLGSQLLAAGTVHGLFLVGLVAVAIARPGAFGRVLDPERLSGTRLGPAHLEVYEAAVARAAHRDAATAAGLPALRERLGVTSAEHEVLTGLYPVAVQPRVPGMAPGVLLADRYRVEARLARGAGSRVFRARDELLDRPVVIKHIRVPAESAELALRRFLREARLTARIEHPNVVDVFDFGYAAGGPYLVMELMPSGSLADRLADQGPLAPREAAGLVADVLSGLAHLHAQGLVHRDLKPSNVLLSETGAKVGDLGLALPLSGHETQDLDVAGAPGAGTPAYMAPEVLRGQAPSPRSDLYAVGALLYEAIHGRHYLGLEGDSYQEIYHRVHARQAGPAVSGDALATVWARALAPDPAARYPHAEAMRADLLGALASRAVEKE